jgi:predicted Rossmann fold nucleotide-binding protein DprA/Smf involved in DNA uptake
VSSRCSIGHLTSNNTNNDKKKKRTLFPSNKKKKLKKIKLTKDNIYFPKRLFLITNPPNLLYKKGKFEKEKNSHILLKITFSWLFFFKKIN